MSRFARWWSDASDALEERTGLRTTFTGIADEEIRGGAKWGRVFGSALLALLVVEALTGFALATAYAPSSQNAWASVHHIQNVVTLGWLVRGVHFFGSHAIVVLLGLHLARAAIVGAYKRPREVSWWLGLALFGIVFGLAVTGGRLPWDQPSYWALVVESNVVAAMPLIGGPAQRLLQGGARVGHLTLTRLYALHVAVLPLLLLLLTTWHLRLRRRHGWKTSVAAGNVIVERRSKQLAFDAIASLLGVLVVVGLAVRAHGAPLDAPADSLTDYPARPEWFLMPLYELRKAFSSAEIIATVVIPGIITTLLVALPLIDKSEPEGGRETPRRRLPIVALLSVIGLAGAGLVFKARARDAGDPKLQRARASADQRAQYANQLASAGVPPEGPLEMLARDPMLHGERLWKNECAVCHTLDGKGGPKGTGGTSPDLKGWGTAAWVEETMRNPDGVLRFGKSPFKGEMPSSTKAPPGKEADFKPMPEADVKAVASFVAGEKVASYDRGKEVFGDACGGCHKLDGKGGDDSELAPDLTGWGSYVWLKNQVVDPANGATYKPEASAPDKKGHMPAFGRSDISDEVEVIARWAFFNARGRWPTSEESKAAANISVSAAAPPPSASAPTGSASAAPAESASAAPSTKPPPAPKKKQ